MTPAHKTSAILLAAGLLAGMTLLLTRILPTSESAPAPGGLELAAGLASSHLMLGTSDTHMAITLTAPESADTRERPPVNLAIVIDRSGSMAGEKLMHARAAARQMVSQLGATDRVAIVTYGSDVTVNLPSTRATPEARDAALRAIDAIFEDGATNLSGGLEAGRDQIARHREAGAVQRVVLISDGLANEGIIDPEGLAHLAEDIAHRGMSITTLGVGLDFDEQTMTRIAVNGRGNYYFAESSFMLADLFARELARLGATTATSVRLAVAPAPGVEVLDAYGYPAYRENDRIFIPVADLHAGETRKVVLRLRVRADRQGDRAIAGVEVSFRPTSTSESRTMNATARATITGRPDLVHAGRDREAIRHIERARTAQVINEATRKYEAGDAQGASQMLVEYQQEARTLAVELGDSELAEEIGQTAQSVGRDFAVPPDMASSTGRNRAAKVNRKRAYDLLY